VANWTVYEYARLYRDSRTAYSNNNLLLNERQFDALKGLIKSDELDHDKLFRYGFERKREVLICQNYVGVVCLPDGDQIEILPKTHRHAIFSDEQKAETIASNRNNLIRMLKATRRLPYRSASSALLDTAHMPLLDVFLQLFLNEVNKLVKRGVARAYETQEDNLAYLRGKLLVSRHIKHNLVMKHRHFMAFDELSGNRPENRLIRSALQWTVKRVEGRAEHLCQELLFHFSSIPESQSIRSDMDSWQGGRLLRHYEPVFPWLEMIFRERSPTSVEGESDMLSLLFPMERVFEDYVVQRLKAQFPEMNVHTPTPRKSLVAHTSRKSHQQQMFQLRPDLMLLHEGRVIIADTKWKLIDESLPRKKYKISEADFYQMLAYNQVYQKEERDPEIWLIYPRSELFTQALPDFIFENGLKIKVMPFDLGESALLGS